MSDKQRQPWPPPAMNFWKRSTDVGPNATYWVDVSDSTKDARPPPPSPPPIFRTKDDDASACRKAATEILAIMLQPAASHRSDSGASSSSTVCSIEVRRTEDPAATCRSHDWARRTLLEVGFEDSDILRVRPIPGCKTRCNVEVVVPAPPSPGPGGARANQNFGPASASSVPSATAFTPSSSSAVAAEQASSVRAASNAPLPPSLLAAFGGALPASRSATSASPPSSAPPASAGGASASAMAVRPPPGLEDMVLNNDTRNVHGLRPQSQLHGHQQLETNFTSGSNFISRVQQDQAQQARALQSGSLPGEVARGTLEATRLSSEVGRGPPGLGRDPEAMTPQPGNQRTSAVASSSLRQRAALPARAPENASLRSSGKPSAFPGAAAGSAGVTMLDAQLRQQHREDRARPGQQPVKVAPSTSTSAGPNGSGSERNSTIGSLTPPEDASGSGSPRGSSAAAAGALWFWQQLVDALKTCLEPGSTLRCLLPAIGIAATWGAAEVAWKLRNRNAAHSLS